MNNKLLVVENNVKLQNAKLNLTCGKSSRAWLVVWEDFIIFSSSESFKSYADLTSFDVSSLIMRK
jgi:hypothetical protein